MNLELFESKPRWPDGPKICLSANLPAFETKELMQSFQESHCGKASKEWLCDSCKCWHYEPIPHCPAGSTSGTTRRKWNAPDRAEFEKQMLARWKRDAMYG